MYKDYGFNDVILITSEVSSPARRTGLQEGSGLPGGPDFIGIRPARRSGIEGFRYTPLFQMGIVVVLASVALPTFGKYMETARETADMELIRTYYDETLAFATLDAEDGKLDGKISGDDGSTETTIQFGPGIALTTDGDGKSYTVTLTNCEPKAKFKQTEADWQYTNKYVGGVGVGPVTNGKDTIVYAFAFDTTAGNKGEVKCSSITPGT